MGPRFYWLTVLEFKTWGSAYLLVAVAQRVFLIGQEPETGRNLLSVTTKVLLQLSSWNCASLWLQGNVTT